MEKKKLKRIKNKQKTINNGRHKRRSASLLLTVHFSTTVADQFLDMCHFCLCSHFFLASVSSPWSSYAVGLTSPDSLDMRLAVGGIILKYTIFLFFFFWKPKAGTQRVAGKHPHWCGQHLSKPSLSRRDNEASALPLAGHHQGQNTSNFAPNEGALVPLSPHNAAY